MRRHPILLAVLLLHRQLLLSFQLRLRPPALLLPAHKDEPVVHLTPAPNGEHARLN
ncbi:hypothetical protein [Nocardia inohanensis]|uniref:hypothetical protein n=1 Tax=Nocardia inohanensis TaxID=209246 RepID=UPI000B16251B|nr:hypothetical protein [Nocardia inohanensis]